MPYVDLAFRLIGTKVPVDHASIRGLFGKESVFCRRFTELEISRYTPTEAHARTIGCGPFFAAGPFYRRCI